MPRPSLHDVALQVFAALPRPVRHRVVRYLSPTFTGGAVVAATRPDGRVLLVTHAYNTGWGLPGGLLDRGETPAITVRREVREEVGLDVDVQRHATAVLTPGRRHFNYVFTATVDDAAADAVAPATSEITDADWFALDDLPHLMEYTDLLLGAVGLLPHPDEAGPPEG